MKIEALVFFLIGLMAGVGIPYLFHLVSMLLRHCGGM